MLTSVQHIETVSIYFLHLLFTVQNEFTINNIEMIQDPSSKL